MDSTEDCKNFLAQITGIPQASWKRTAKKKDGERVLRTFTDTDGRVAVVSYHNNVFVLVSMSEYIGKFKDVIFGREDDDDDDYVSFYCGKKDGDHLDDQHDPENDELVEATLIAAGFEKGQLDIGAAENYHMIKPRGQTHQEVYERVRIALTNAGAVERTDL